MNRQKSSEIRSLGQPVRMYRGQHSKTCQCPSCLLAKVGLFEEKLELMNGVPPPTRFHRIAVKPHWRRVNRSNPVREMTPFERVIMNYVIDLVNQNKQMSKKSRRK